MLKLLILVAALVAGVGFIFYQVAKFAFQINNPAGMAKRDGHKLRALLGPYLDKLVPLTIGEMELFALNKETKRIKKGRHIITTGVYNSIYHEPLLAFAYKEYKGRNISTLMGKTRDLEYFYISINGETRVFLNGKAFGIISSTGDLYTPDKSKMIASISPEDVLELHPVKIGDKEIGSVLNPKQTELKNPRAFQMLDNMTDKEQEIFLSLSILSLVEESL